MVGHLTDNALDYFGTGLTKLLISHMENGKLKEIGVNITRPDRILEFIEIMRYLF